MEQLTNIHPEVMRNKRRNELIAEFLSIYFLASLPLDPNTEHDIDNISKHRKTSFEEQEASSNTVKELKERILKIMESFPTGHTQDLQINAILNEVHALGLSERIHHSIEEEKKRIAREVNEIFKKKTAEGVSEEVIAERVSKLREVCFDAHSPETSEKIREDFPTGNFLFHGTNVTGMVNVIDSGNLSNYKRLQEEEKRKAETEGRKPNYPPRNSGYEGISWSFNQVDALPGTRYHLAGFLTSPEQATTKGDQLSIPSRPAPYELLQVGGELDSNLYFELKTQQEIFGPAIYDSNIVSNLVYFEMGLSGQRESAIGNFLKGEVGISELENLLRSKFSLNEDGTMEFYPDLIQQRGEIIPPALVWIQGLIDSGRIKNVPEFEGCKNVYDVLGKFNSETYKSLLKESKKDIKKIEDRLDRFEENISEVSIQVSEMYLVIPESDLENYLRLLAIKGIKPKGIIVYASNKVMIENFASKSKGDAEEFSQILRNVIPERDGVIDYESQLLGLKITQDVRGGHAGQVIKESALGKRKVLKNKDGNFVIE